MIGYPLVWVETLRETGASRVLPCFTSAKAQIIGFWGISRRDV